MNEADKIPLNCEQGEHACAAMASLQGSALEFVAWVVAAGFIGAMTARAMGKQRKAVREAIYGLCVLVGMVLAVLHYQGKLPV
tara:strand:+ start:78 stop:326 length:249 start_codon:yes stop_codon:yes gene_type:complete